MIERRRQLRLAVPRYPSALSCRWFITSFFSSLLPALTLWKIKTCTDLAYPGLDTRDVALKWGLDYGTRHCEPERVGSRRPQMFDMMVWSARGIGAWRLVTAVVNEMVGLILGLCRSWRTEVWW